MKIIRNITVSWSFSGSTTGLTGFDVVISTTSPTTGILVSSNQPINLSNGTQSCTFTNVAVDSDIPFKVFVRSRYGTSLGDWQDMNGQSTTPEVAIGEVSLGAKIYFQTTQPTSGSLGDMWYDTDDNYRLYVYNGTTYVVGAAGADASVSRLNLSSYLLSKSTSGVYAPAVITSTSFRMVGNQQPTSPNAVFKVYLNGSSTATITSGSVASYDYTVPANTTSIKIEMYDASGATLLDSSSVQVVSSGASGANAINPILTNPTHVLAVSNTGVIDYNASGTDVYVYEGAAPLTYNTSGGNGTWKFSSGPTGTGISVGSITSHTTYVTIANASAATASSASIVFPISGTTVSGTAFTATVTQTLKQVTAGADSTKYWINNSTPVIVKDAKDAATTGSYTTFTSTGVKTVGGTSTSYGYITVTANGDTEATTASNAFPITTAPTNTCGKSSYTVKLYNQATVSGATLLDTQTVNVVFKGLTGAAAITASLSNNSFTVPCDSAGNVFSGGLTLSGTNLYVYEGGTTLNAIASGTPTAGQFKVTAVGTNITAGAVSVTNNICSIADHSSITANTATVVYTYTGVTSGGQSFSNTITQTLAKTKAGSDAYVYDIIPSAPVITKTSPDAATTGTYSTITLQGTRTIGGTKANFGWITTTEDSGTESARSDTSSTALSYTMSTGKSTVTVKMYDAASGGTLVDTQVIPCVFKGAVGTNAVVGTLTNSNVTVPAAADGSGTSLTNAGGTFRVFDGTTEKTTSGSVTYSVAGTATQSGVTMAINSSGVYSFTGTWANTPDTLTWTLQAIYNGVTLQQVYTISKSKTGSTGKSVSSVTTYFQLSTSNSTAPTGTWSTTAQTTTATNKYLWSYQTFTFSDSTTLDTTKIVVGTYGDTGNNGKGISSITNYYQVSASSSTAPTSGWSTTPPTLTVINKFLWNYEHIVYTDSSTFDTTACVIGAYGDSDVAKAYALVNNNPFLVFTGASNKNFTGLIDLDGNPTFSISAWVKRTGTISNQGLWGIGADTNLCGICSYTSSSYPNKVAIDLWGTATFNANYDYPLNTWVHVAWVKRSGDFNTTNVSIFINGTEYTGANLTVQRGSTHTPTLNTSTKGVTIGGISPTTSTYNSSVNVNNFTLVNYAMTSTQVSAIYNNTPTFIGDLNATANTFSTGVEASRPTGSNGDVYYATDTKKLWTKISGAWTYSSNAFSSLAEVDSTANTKLGGIATGATKNTLYNQGGTVPSASNSGDIWYVSSTTAGYTTYGLYQSNGTSWTIVGNNFTNTNQLTDGANLGGTATWTGVGSKPSNLSSLTGSEDILNSNIVKSGLFQWFTTLGNGSDAGVINTSLEAGAINISGSTTRVNMVSSAFPVASGQGSLTIVLDAKASAAISSGFYLRVIEYDGNLTSTQSHVGWWVSDTSGPAMTRELTSWYENQPLTISYVTKTITYTPTSTAKWASVLIIREAGAGTASIYAKNFKILNTTTQQNIDAAATTANYSNLTGTPSNAIANSSITIASNGTLSGGGGGQVTITGLGYTGALDATKNQSDATTNGYITYTKNAGVLTWLSDFGAADSTITYGSPEAGAVALSHASDTSIGMCSTAFRVNDGKGTLQFSLDIKASAASSTGVYIRINEYDAELALDKTHIGYAGVGATGVQNGTREITSFYENSAVTTGWVTKTFSYTPTTSAKWASLEVLKWDAIPTTTTLYIRNVNIGGVTTLNSTLFDGTNLAVGSTFTASGTITNVTYLTDGNKSLNAGYCDYTAGAQWIKSDFSSVKYVAETRIYFYDLDNRTYQYRVSYSIDGTTWVYVNGSTSTYVTSRATQLGLYTASTIIPTIVPINAFARYLRIESNGNTINTGNHILEWEIWSTGGGEDPYAIALAAQAQANAISTASTDATTKANTAQSTAISTASSDATAKTTNVPKFNMLKNSELLGNVMTPWTLGWNPNNAVIPSFNTTYNLWSDTYVIKGANGIAVNQTGTNGSVGGQDANIACDIYPLGTWDGTMINAMSVQGNHKYEFSIYGATHRANYIWLGIQYFDSSKNYITEHNSGWVSVNDSLAVNSLDMMTRVYVMSTAPSNACYAMVYIRKHNTTSGGDSWMWIVHPYFGECPTSQTTPSPYTPAVQEYVSANKLIGGSLTSQNWTGAAGSFFDLNAGDFKFGGSTNPRLSFANSTGVLSLYGKMDIIDGTGDGTNGNFVSNHSNNSKSFAYLGMTNNIWLGWQMTTTENAFFAGGSLGTNQSWVEIMSESATNSSGYAGIWSRQYKNYIYADILEANQYSLQYAAGLLTSMGTTNAMAHLGTSIHAGRCLTGGGTVSVSSSFEVNWSARFIVIGSGRGATSALSGLWNIEPVTSGGTVYGFGGAANKTTTANGIPLAPWESVYYVLPMVNDYTSRFQNFKVVSYTADFNPPINWLKICTYNGDGGYVEFANNVSLRPGTSINTNAYDVLGSDVQGNIAGWSSGSMCGIWGWSWWNQTLTYSTTIANGVQGNCSQGGILFDLSFVPNSSYQTHGLCVISIGQVWSASAGNNVVVGVSISTDSSATRNFDQQRVIPCYGYQVSHTSNVQIVCDIWNVPANTTVYIRARVSRLGGTEACYTGAVAPLGVKANYYAFRS